MLVSCIDNYFNWPESRESLERFVQHVNNVNCLIGTSGNFIDDIEKCIILQLSKVFKTDKCYDAITLRSNSGVVSFEVKYNMTMESSLNEHGVSNDIIVPKDSIKSKKYKPEKRLEVNRRLMKALKGWK